MAIVAKSVLAARRAAAAAAASVKDEERVTGAAALMAEAVLASDEEPKTTSQLDTIALPKRRGHAVKDENGKWQPTGPVGFAQPPVDKQFKKGGKGGPGRPKGSVSHDALMEKHLKQKREVSVGGRRKTISTHEILVMSTVKDALGGKDKHARTYALAHSERLYPSREANDNPVNAPALSESDALSITEYENELRARIRDEILEELKRDGVIDSGRGR